MKQTINNSGIKYIVFTILLVIFQSALLFIAAGNVTIFRYWLFVIVNFIYILFSLILMYYKVPELLNARGYSNKDADKQDIILAKLINIQMVFILPVIIGLDHRLNWSYLNNYFIIIGFIFYIYSNILVLSSMIANKYFETNIRLQSDRDHQVVKVWPYNFVRHPGYAGTILWLIGVPMILGSFFGLILSVLIIAEMIIRTGNEDSFLTDNLDGYKEYHQDVKYRLFFGIW